jgi:hypothetical protein
MPYVQKEPRHCERSVAIRNGFNHKDCGDSFSLCNKKITNKKYKTPCTH